jgi:hypothetical protein
VIPSKGKNEANKESQLRIRKTGLPYKHLPVKGWVIEGCYLCVFIGYHEDVYIAYETKKYKGIVQYLVGRNHFFLNQNLLSQHQQPRPQEKLLEFAELLIYSTSKTCTD